MKWQAFLTFISFCGQSGAVGATLIPEQPEFGKAVHGFKRLRIPQVVDRIALIEALAQLAPGCREVFVLFDIEGCSHVEIARMPGFTVGNFKSQLYKARMKIRRLLKSVK